MARTIAQPQQGGSTGQPPFGQPQQQQGQGQDARQQQAQEASVAPQQGGQPIFRDWASI